VAGSIRRAIWGGALHAVLVVCGWLLLQRAVAAGAPRWPSYLFLVIAVLLAGTQALRFAQTLARARTTQHEALAQGKELRRAFREFGVGDVVRGLAITRTLPGHLATSFQAGASSLASMAQRFQDGSIGVAGAAEGVEHVAAELAAGSSQQAASAVEITAAMEELAQTAAQIAEHAGRQAQLAAGAEAAGVAGGAAVDDAVAGVAAVQQRIQAISGRADTLGTRSQEIFRVLELITEIAQETHILSLNAAIEAAAAGDRGRRFAVVAEEVRRLAQRTRESAESVRGLVEEFAGAIRATVVATEEGSKEAARVLDAARSAAGAISQLRDASAGTARVARETSLVTQQQTAASEEVVATLRDLSQVVQRMSRDLQQLSADARRLSKVAVAIQLQAQTFHLDSPRSLKHLIGGWLERLDASPAGSEAAVLEELVANAPFVELGYYVDAASGALTEIVNRQLFAGRAVASSEDLRKVNLRQRPWYRAAERDRRAVVLPPHTSVLSGQPCITVACPRFGADGSLRGVLGMDIHMAGWRRV